MSHVTAVNGSGRVSRTRGAAFAAALAETGIAKRAVARHICGPDATDREISNKLSQVRRWANPKLGFEDETAELLAGALTQLSGRRYPPDAFKTPRLRQTSQTERDANLERRLLALEGALEQLGPELKKIANRVRRLEQRDPPRTQADES